MNEPDNYTDADYEHFMYEKHIAELEAYIENYERELLIAKAHPMQPIIDGRFKENKIVSYCLDNKTDMNRIAMKDFTDDDRMQFAQLIGYSLGGYSDLSYVTDESYYRAEKET